MLQFLLDTDHLTLFEHAHPALLQHIASQAQGAVELAVVSVEESLRGRLATIAKATDGQMRIRRYGQLVKSLQLFTQFPLAIYEQAVEDRFQQLRLLRLRIGSRDLKIAATALASQLVLVTRNRRDFAQVPGLLIEDWSV